MRSIVENLLMLARADDGALELYREPVDLSDVTEAVTENASALARPRQVMLATDGPSVIVTGDRARIEQVVMNLVNNAIRFSPVGGGGAASRRGRGTAARGAPSTTRVRASHRSWPVTSSSASSAATPLVRTTEGAGWVSRSATRSWRRTEVGSGSTHARAPGVPSPSGFREPTAHRPREDPAFMLSGSSEGTCERRSDAAGPSSYVRRAVGGARERVARGRVVVHSGCHDDAGSIGCAGREPTGAGSPHPGGDLPRFDDRRGGRTGRAGLARRRLGSAAGGGFPDLRRGTDVRGRRGVGGVGSPRRRPAPCRAPSVPRARRRSAPGSLHAGRSPVPHPCRAHGSLLRARGADHGSAVGVGHGGRRGVRLPLLRRAGSARLRRRDREPRRPSGPRRRVDRR